MKSQNVTIQMKATELKWILSRGAVYSVYYAVQGGSKLLSLWVKSLSATIHMKATEQYFPVVLFNMLYSLVLLVLLSLSVAQINHWDQRQYHRVTHIECGLEVKQKTVSSRLHETTCFGLIDLLFAFLTVARNLFSFAY